MCQALCKVWLNTVMNKMDTVLACSVYRPLLDFMNCLLKSLVCFSTKENIVFLPICISISYIKDSNPLS